MHNTRLICVQAITYSNRLCVYRFATCCWISLIIGSEGSWEFRVRGNLTYREDTGLINSSPVVNILPLIRLQHGCNHIIKIPGKDVNIDSHNHDDLI